MLVWLTWSASAQQLTYKGEFVDTVKIISSFGYYHFDSLGTSTGAGEEYLIAFNSKRKGYSVVSHKKTAYQQTSRPECFSSSEKQLKSGQKIKRQDLYNMLSHFEKGTLPRDFDHTGMNQKEFFKLTNRKHIRRLAKRHHAEKYFKRSYTDKAEIESLFKGCQNLDTLNLYLATAFTGFPMPSDAGGGFDVYIVTSKNFYQFRDSYSYLSIQHWYDLSDTSVVLPPPMVNFPVNKALLEILPEDFYGLSSLGYKLLVNGYIAWYLTRRDIYIN